LRFVLIVDIFVSAGRRVREETIMERIRLCTPGKPLSAASTAAVQPSITPASTTTKKKRPTM